MVALDLRLFEPLNTSSLDYDHNTHVGPGSRKEIKVYLNFTEKDNCMNVTYGDGSWEIYGFSKDICIHNKPTVSAFNTNICTY